MKHLTPTKPWIRTLLALILLCNGFLSNASSFGLSYGVYSVSDLYAQDLFFMRFGWEGKGKNTYAWGVGTSFDDNVETALRMSMERTLKSMEQFVPFWTFSTGYLMGKFPARYSVGKGGEISLGCKTDKALLFNTGIGLKADLGKIRVPLKYEIGLIRALEVNEDSYSCEEWRKSQSSVVFKKLSNGLFMSVSIGIEIDINLDS